jgi:hypothetical protein
MFATVAVAELDPATLAQKLSQGAPLLGAYPFLGFVFVLQTSFHLVGS